MPTTHENLFKMAVYLYAIHFVLINNQNFPKAVDQLQKDLCGGGECEEGGDKEKHSKDFCTKAIHFLINILSSSHPKLSL